MIEDSGSLEGIDRSSCNGNIDDRNDPPARVHLYADPVGDGSRLLGPVLETKTLALSLAENNRSPVV